MFDQKTYFCLSLFTFVFVFRLSFAEENITIDTECRELISGCNCYDLDKIGLVRCWNGTELFATKYLLDGSIFPLNMTYEINIEGGIKILPPSCIEGLIVFRLILDNPDIQDVHEDAFQGVLRLRRFHVRRSSIKKIPNFRPIRDSFRNLNLDNSLLTSLEGDALRNLPLLEYISFFNNSIQQIDSDVFQGTEKVIIFDISYNKLAYLPPHLFDSWKKLRKVALSHNQLLHVKSLFQITRPLFIYLDYNNLTDLDSILPSTTVNLTTILLSHNPLERVTANSFNHKAPNIRFIYMDNCLIRNFDVNHYKYLPHLNTLDLSYNKIEIMPSQSLNIGTNLELVLVGNVIKEFNAEMDYHIKRIYLDNNHLKNLGKTLQFTQLTEVSVAYNELQQLRQDDFVGANELNVLKLQENRIQWIDRSAFNTIRNDLNNLDLSENLLTSLNGSVRYLSQLKYLNLTSNLITGFEDGEFIGLNELSELYVRNNRIIILGGQIQQLPQLQFLELSSNRIQTLKMEQIPKSLQYLYLQDNPLRCDCKLFPFLQWLNSTGAPTTDYILCLSSSVPPTPSHVSSCPSGCNCFCTKDTNEYFMTLDCSAKNISILPQLLLHHNIKDEFCLKINFQMMFIDENTTIDNLIAVVDNIGGINLSNNNLDSLEHAPFPNNLRHLFLHNNKLKKMPNELLKDFSQLRKISLSGNPWNCDCDTVDFRRCILSNKERILDGNETLCGKSGASGENALEGKPIWKTDDRDLCPVLIGFYFSVGFGVIAFSLVIAVFKIVHSKYEYNIKVWLYSQGFKWVKGKDKEIDKDKRFDAFISFSDKDGFLVSSLIQMIEAEQPNTRLCHHYRDFIAGKLIESNILEAVKQAKRTVLILSKNFHESKWCMFEFNAAHQQTLEDKFNRLIIIKLGDLPDKIDPVIKLYLESTTYLTYGEKYFWYKLLYALPTSSRSDVDNSLSNSDAEDDSDNFRNSTTHLV